MSLKTKLVSTISAICMVLALLTVGVWAVSTASVTLGGSVSFTADNIHARVTGSVTGTQETISLAQLDYSADTAPSEDNINTWANNQMTFTSENLITMTITVENLSEERSLFVTLTDNTTTDNVNKTLKQGASNYTSSSAVEVTAGNTTTFTMTLSVTDKNQSASATVSYQVDLRDANAEVEESLLKHDTENDYYYVEMGEYQGAPVRWRVVGVEGEHYTYNESQAPTGELTFIQQTATTSHIFGHYYNNEETGEDLANGDYATSAIRQYITGTDCALDADGQDMTVTGNYLEDIGIDENNAIYKQIKARDIQDLYKNICWDDNSNISDGTTTAIGSDKLWIPSVAEIYSLVGGGDLSTISNSWTTEIQESIKFYDSTNSAQWYWSRSYWETDTGMVYSGFSGMTMGYPGDDYAVRPMFILEF